MAGKTLYQKLWDAHVVHAADDATALMADELTAGTRNTPVVHDEIFSDQNSIEEVLTGHHKRLAAKASNWYLS